MSGLRDLFGPTWRTRLETAVGLAPAGLWWLDKINGGDLLYRIGAGT